MNLAVLASERPYGFMGINHSKLFTEVFAPQKLTASVYSATLHRDQIKVSTGPNLFEVLIRDLLYMTVLIKIKKMGCPEKIHRCNVIC